MTILRLINVPITYYLIMKQVNFYNFVGEVCYESISVLS